MKLIVFMFYAFITLMLLGHITLAEMYLRSKKVSISFFIGRIFKIPFLIRPWECEPEHRKGSVWASFQSLPVTFHSELSVTQDGYKWPTVSLLLHSFLPKRYCSLKSQPTRYTEAQKFICACMMEEESKGTKMKSKQASEDKLRLIVWAYLATCTVWHN